MSAPDEPASNSRLEALRTALDDVKAPFCSGTLEVDDSNLLLFYGNNLGTAGRIDLKKATDVELRRLAEACEPATFGINKKDVLDESYRRAGKLDERNFATKLELTSTGLMEVIRFGLLEGSSGTRAFHAELYNLNVYDKCAFFKPHKDTPRAENMFGSLVIVFPTVHEGGALLLRHGGKEWTVDSGRLAEVKKDDDPEQAHIVFATFFSDVEHEVTPVKSGYRVTLTYNLYFDTSSNPTVDHSLQVTEKTIPSEAGVFKTALANLLQDKTFLPEGGSFGFGLYHQYPVDKSSKNIRDLHKFLKGRDALIVQVCKEFPLDANIWLLYGDEDEVQFLSDHLIDIDGVGEEESFSSVALQDGGVRLVRDPDADDYDGDIVWVRKISDLNQVTEKYAAYGNHYYLGCAYANACLVVDIGPPGNRSKEAKQKEPESSEPESSEPESS